MPMPIPKGQQITVQRNTRSSDYCMPSMEISTDHYDISYIISGDRKSITPLKSFNYHTGDVAMGVPFLYHQTISQSDVPYDNYLVKYTPQFIEPFINNVGKNIFDELNEQRICRFSKEIQEKLKNMFQEMLNEYNKNTPYKEFILQGMLFKLLTTIYENKLDANVTEYKKPLSKPILETIYYIENNYELSLTLEKVAKTFHFSAGHFSRLFISSLGISFTEYLSNVRIRHAKRLLIQTSKSIMEIALEIGYCNGDYFSSRFKSKTGMTPSEFRNNVKNKTLNQS